MYERYVELLNEKQVRNIDVSRATGIPSSTFSDWKKGKSSPKYDKIQKIANFFNVQLDYLTGESEFKTREEMLQHFDKNFNSTKENKMNDVQIFTSEDFGSIRTIVINNEPWFVGKDVAVALGYSNASKAVMNHVDEEDKITEISAYSQNGNTVGKLTFINESGIYSLIFSSKLANAKKFKRWVTSEVLPTIRKTGHYEMDGYKPKSTSLGEVVNLIKVTRETMKDQGADPTDIAIAVKDICEKFGVILPDCFIKPKEATMSDVYDMIDFIFSQPMGKGHKKPTYEDYIIHKANVKMLNMKNKRKDD